MTLQLLGGRTVKQFLARHWQRRPLLIRQAMPGFTGIVQPPELLRLAEREDVESRWIARSRDRWDVRQGPFSRTTLGRAPRRNWTLLVQGVNLHDARADALLQRFSFLPHARLDDVMISYAVPGGGVGPHLDSYDVFLLQNTGRRRWRIGPAKHTALVPDAPLKLLRDFEPTKEWVLEPGDMLYLPPGYAHDGVAVDACSTCSIGFRAPSPRELGRALLGRLEESLDGRLGDAGYRDAGIRPQPAGRIPAALARFARESARRLLPGQTEIDQALGEYLSEPKALVSFSPPAVPLSERRFLVSATRRGLRLDAGTRLLYDRHGFYVNGEMQRSAPGRQLLSEFADRRALDGRACRAMRPGAPLSRLLYDWYRAGWLHLPD